MDLLTDEKLIGLVVGDEPIISGFPDPVDDYCKDAPIQPASVDLHIGDIFVPQVPPYGPGGEHRPLKECTLKTGHTVVVATLERLKLPSGIAGIGFPPSHVSVKGLLMTNPGHVDPGYVGPMRFAVINFGGEPYRLKRGDTIVTLLLFRLSSPPRADWLQRNRREGAPPTREEIDKLSRDFVNIEKRAKQISRSVLLQATTLAAAVGLLVAASANSLASYLTGLWDVKESSVKVELRVDDLQRRIEVLQSEVEAPSRQPENRRGR